MPDYPQELRTKPNPDSRRYLVEVNTVTNHQNHQVSIFPNEESMPELHCTTCGIILLEWDRPISQYEAKRSVLTPHLPFIREETEVGGYGHSTLNNPQKGKSPC